VLLWAAGAPSRLPAETRALLEAPENLLHFSPANLWEIVIKNGLGRDDFQVDAHALRRGLLDNGYRELCIDSSHVLMVQNLPGIHQDPFDRMLIAQAMVEGLTLITSDGLVVRYPVTTVRVAV
jgi:PIN domain nuclease of toxin-antitoxin system